MAISVDWTTDEQQRTVVRLSGEGEIVLWEEVTDDGPRITSDAFKQPQKDLGRALELALTNTVMAAYRQRRDRDLPVRSVGGKRLTKAEEVALRVDEEVRQRVRPLLAAMVNAPDHGLDDATVAEIAAFLDGGPVPPFLTDSHDSDEGTKK